MRTDSNIFLLILILLGQNPDLVAQSPRDARLLQMRDPRSLEMNQIPSSIAPPVISPPSISKTQTMSQFRIRVFKEFLHKASQPQYRFANDQMYDLQPLTNFLSWIADLPASPETTAMLKTKTRPLTNWSLVYGRIAQITDRNGILLWKYEEPEMVANPKLIRLLNYPKEKTLADGDILVVFAKNGVPYSYIDSSRSKSTVNSYDYGKPVTKQEVEVFMQRRPLPAIRLPPRTNIPPVYR